MRTKILILTTLIPLALLLATCSKDEGACISSTGKIITRDMTNQAYQVVEVYDNINLILTQDTSHNKIMVEAGENLIEGITARVDSGKLVLRNENRCNWLRSFEVPVNVHLTFTQLDTIIFRAAGNISCTNSWTNESLSLDVIEGSGQIDLKINTYRTYVIVRYGTTNIHLHGSSQVTTLISYGFGPLHAENLTSKFTYISSYSSNDLFAYSSVDLQVEIGNIGNVYYTGNPATISSNIHGAGKLIGF